jgi:flagellar FliJ protein
MSTVLATLLQQAESERDQTRHSLAQAEQQLRRMQMQTQQLASYRSDTLERARAAQGQWSDVARLRSQQSFVDRLDQALTQQRQAEQTVQRRCDALRQQLLAQELRVASVRKLLLRRQQAQDIAEARRDQRRSDEAALQALWRAADAHGAQPGMAPGGAF